MIPDEDFGFGDEEEGIDDQFDKDDFDPSEFHFFHSYECDACTFLCSIILDGNEYDLWAHVGDGDPTVFARYGDDGHHNIGGASFGEALTLRLPNLPEDHQALRIAWLIANDLGLMPRLNVEGSAADNKQPA